MPTYGFAKTTNDFSDNPVHLQYIDQQTIKVYDKEATSVITVKTIGKLQKTEINSSDSRLNGYFLLDEELNTIYSSYTHQTITLDKVDLSTEAILRARSPKKIIYQYTSYRKLRALVGVWADAGTILAGLAAMFVGGSFNPGLITTINGILSAFSHGIPDDPNHGLKLKVQVSGPTKYIRHGKPVYVYSYLIIGVSKY